MLKQLLFLAGHEMREVRALSHELFCKTLDKSYYYFGVQDDWCPQKYVSSIVALIEEQKGTSAYNYYQVDDQDLGHAFVVGGADKMAVKLAQLIAYAHKID